MLTVEEAIKAMKEFQKKKNATDEESCFICNVSRR